MRLVWRIRLGLFACGLLLGAGLAAWRWATPDWDRVAAHLAAAHPQVQTMDASALHQALAAEPEPLLIDVRTAAEYRISRLPNARHAEQVDTIAELIEQSRAADPQRPVILYCAVGLRSAEHLAELAVAGITDVHHLEQGIFGWVMNGHLAETPDGRPTAIVHPYDWRWGRLLPEQFHPD